MVGNVLNLSLSGTFNCGRACSGTASNAVAADPVLMAEHMPRPETTSWDWIAQLEESVPTVTAEQAAHAVAQLIPSEAELVAHAVVQADPGALTETTSSETVIEQEQAELVAHAVAQLNASHLAGGSPPEPEVTAVAELAAMEQLNASDLPETEYESTRTDELVAQAVAQLDGSELAETSESGKAADRAAQAEAMHTRSVDRGECVEPSNPSVENVVDRGKGVQQSNPSGAQQVRSTRLVTSTSRLAVRPQATTPVGASGAVARASSAAPVKASVRDSAIEAADSVRAAWEHLSRARECAARQRSSSRGSSSTRKRRSSKASASGRRRSPLRSHPGPGWRSLLRSSASAPRRRSSKGALGQRVARPRSASGRRSPTSQEGCPSWSLARAVVQRAIESSRTSGQRRPSESKRSARSARPARTSRTSLRSARPSARRVHRRPGGRLKVAVLLVMLGGGAFFLAPRAETEPSRLDSDAWMYELVPAFENTPALRSDTANDPASAPVTEVCEFLARPATRLYIDGQLVSAEIPPIYRTELAVGGHTVHFVSATNRTHELRVHVVAGSPSRWFMNWIENRVDRRSLAR